MPLSARSLRHWQQAEECLDESTFPENRRPAISRLAVVPSLNDQSINQSITHSFMRTARPRLGYLECLSLNEQCWDTIVRKSRELMYIGKFSKPLALEAAPRISHKNLSSLVEEHLPSLQDIYFKPFDYHYDSCCCYQKSRSFVNKEQRCTVSQSLLVRLRMSFDVSSSSF